MEARELRQGNILDYYGQECIVLEILKNDYVEFGYFTDSIGFNRKLTEKHSPKPIPLTEEWLLKFGFESYNQKSYKLNIILDNKDTFLVFYSHSGGNIMMSINDPKNDYNLIREINHVHQLQNLYFALTSKELEITKTK